MIRHLAMGPIARVVISAAALGLGGAHLAQAQSLPALLEAARTYDAAFLSARAQFESASFKADQVRALRRPSLSTDVTYGKTVNSTPYSPSITGSKIDATTTNLNAQQPLFNRANDMAVDQAMKALDIAQADYELAEQDLIIRVSQAYFDVLAAGDALSTVMASKAAITEQLASAKRNFEVGTATITDTREAQARYDLVIAQELAATNDVRNKQLALEQLVGRLKVKPEPLKLPMALPALLPDTADAWVTRALSINPNARKAQLGLEQLALRIQHIQVHAHAHLVAQLGGFKSELAG